MTNPLLPGNFDTVLGRWVQVQHLQPDTIADRCRRFRACPERYLVVDDLLVPEHLPNMRKVLLEEGITESFYKAYGLQERVTKERFDGLDDAQRFIYEEIYVAPQADKRMSPAVLTDMLFRKALIGPAFHHWLSAVTGQPVGYTGTINLKRLGREHMLRWHSDGTKGRVLCAVLYLHADWQPDYGGRLMMGKQDGGIDYIEPLTNRLVLFDPQSNTTHAVEPMTEIAIDWSRLNYSAWFYQRNEKAE